MNREETLALYEQGVEAWNKWANEMLKEKKRLEEAGEWEVDENGEPFNQKTKEWFNRAKADFSTEDNPHTFEESANCDKFIFPSTTCFDKATFNSPAQFVETTFYGCASFTNATFKETGWFRKSTFKNRANFSSIVFCKKANFSESIFKRSISFYNCIFEKYAGFKKINFKAYTTFSETTFKDYTQFNGSSFNDYAGFYDCKFHQPSRFDNIKFKGNLDFTNSKFDHAIGFSNSQFHGHTSFRFIQAMNKIEFESSKFKNKTFFSNSSIDGQVNFSNAEFEQSTNFSKNIFYKLALFNAIQTKGAFTLENTTFEKEVPDFIQANFKEAPRLDNIQIGDDVSPGSFKNSITTFIHPDIKARYQALKRLAIQAHDHENEQRFWAGELRSDRSLRTEDGGWRLRPLVSAYWWINIAYGCTSDYGRSIVRPIMALAIPLIIMTILHLSFHLLLLKEEVSKFQNTTNNYKQFQIKGCNAKSAAYRLATKNLAIGTLRDPSKSNTFKRDYNCLYGTYNDDNQTPKIPALILIAEFTQTLLSAIFIFLALLGVRNNFKMK